MSLRQQLNPLASSSQASETPSREDGVPEQLELDLRAFGGILIQQSGILLKVPQVVAATSQVLFQRFYFVASLKHFGIRDIALGSLFLASKLEEHPIRVRDLINVFDYLLELVEYEGRGTMDGSAGGGFKYEPMDYFEQKFYDWKDELVIGEMQILKRLGFNLSVQLPYGTLVNYLQVLELTDHPSIPQNAWSICNDALQTPLYALHPPSLICATSIYLSTLLVTPAVCLPLSPKPWWELFDVEREEDVWEVGRVLGRYYERWGGGFGVLRGGGGGGDGVGGEGGKGVWKRARELGLPVTKQGVRERITRGS